MVIAIKEKPIIQLIREKLIEKRFINEELRL